MVTGLCDHPELLDILANGGLGVLPPQQLREPIQTVSGHASLNADRMPAQGFGIQDKDAVTITACPLCDRHSVAQGTRAQIASHGPVSSFFLARRRLRYKRRTVRPRQLTTEPLLTKLGRLDSGKQQRLSD